MPRKPLYHGSPNGSLTDLRAGSWVSSDRGTAELMGRFHKGTGKTWDDGDLAEPHYLGKAARFKNGRKPAGKAHLYRVVGPVKLDRKGNPYEHTTLSGARLEKIAGRPIKAYRGALNEARWWFLNKRGNPTHPRKFPPRPPDATAAAGDNARPWYQSESHLHDEGASGIHFLGTLAAARAELRLARRGKSAMKTAAAVTPERVHQIAKSRGVPNDTSKRGLRSISKRLTGKAHLDDMTPAELRKVALSLVVSYEMDRGERAGQIKRWGLGRSTGGSNA